MAEERKRKNRKERVRESPSSPWAALFILTAEDEGLGFGSSR